MSDDFPAEATSTFVPGERNAISEGVAHRPGESAEPTSDPAQRQRAEVKSRDDAHKRALAAVRAARRGEEQTEEPEAKAAAPATEGEKPAKAKPTEEAPADEKAKADEEWRKRAKALTTQEQRFRKEREAWKAQAEKTKADLDTLQKQIAAQVEAVGRIQKGDALGGLKALGVDYAKLTQQMLQGGRQQIDPDALREELTAPVNAQLEELKAQLESERKAREEAEQARAVTAYREGLRKTLDEGREERWELLHYESDDPAAEVHEALRIEWESAGKPVDDSGNPVLPLTAEQAADKLEAFLMERAKKRIGAKKLRGLLGDTKPNPETQPQRASERAESTAKPSPTLTNQLAADVTRSGSSADPKQCRQRALTLMRASRS